MRAQVICPGKKKLIKNKRKNNMDLPITKKVHANKSAVKSEICETCKKPIGMQCNCSSGYLHIRGSK